MFRIAFDHKTCRFVVQVLAWCLIWRTCLNPIDGFPLKFVTYTDARHWVNSIGLNTAFIEQDPKKVYS
jgi:hypothetical protein